MGLIYLIRSRRWTTTRGPFHHCCPLPISGFRSSLRWPWLKTEGVWSF